MTTRYAAGSRIFIVITTLSASLYARIPVCPVECARQDLPEAPAVHVWLRVLN